MRDNRVRATCYLLESGEKLYANLRRDGRYLLKIAGEKIGTASHFEHKDISSKIVIAIGFSTSTALNCKFDPSDSKEFTTAQNVVSDMEDFSACEASRLLSSNNQAAGEGRY